MEGKDQLRRLCCALNNVGVWSLERGCHDKAYELLKEAVMAVKITFLPEDSDDLCNELDAKLTRAVKYLSELGDSAIDPTVSVLVLEDTVNMCGVETLLESLDDVESGRRIVPIRLDSSESGSVSSLDPELVAGLVLYNFGLANRCVAAAGSGVAGSTGNVVEHQLRSAAIQLFQCSAALLSNNSRRLSVTPDRMMEQVQTLVVTCVSLAALYATFIADSRHEQAVQCLDRISDYECVLRSIASSQVFGAAVKVASAA